MTSPGVSECDESLVIGIVEWENAHEPVAGRRDWTPARCLRGAAERDDRQMPTSGVVADSEIERDSGLTADEGLRRGAWGTTRPPRAGFEASHLGCVTPMMVDLVGSGGAELRVRPVAVVPGDVGGQFPLHGSEMVRDQNQSPGALVLDGADAALDHCHASVLPDRTDTMADEAAATPALELSGDELAALIGDEVPRLHAGPPEMAFEASPHGGRSGLATEDGEAHDAPRVVIDGHGQPPAERPHLRQGKGYPRSPESERRGHGGEIDVPEVIRLSGGDGARCRLERRTGSRRLRLPQHSTHRRRAEVETGAGEDLGDLDLPQGGAENFGLVSQK